MEYFRGTRDRLDDSGGDGDCLRRLKPAWRGVRGVLDYRASCGCKDGVAEYTHGDVTVFRVPSRRERRRTCERGVLGGPITFLRCARLAGRAVTTRTRDCEPSCLRQGHAGGCGSRRRPGVRRHTSAQFSLREQPRTCMTVCPALSIAIPFNLRLPPSAATLSHHPLVRGVGTVLVSIGVDC